MHTERSAAISILSSHCGMPVDESKSTDELWQQVFLNDVSFANDYINNIFNEHGSWKKTCYLISTAKSIQSLKDLFFTYSKKLQNHPQFIREFTLKKKKLIRK